MPLPVVRLFALFCFAVVAWGVALVLANDGGAGALGVIIMFALLAVALALVILSTWGD